MDVESEVMNENHPARGTQGHPGQYSLPHPEICLLLQGVVAAAGGGHQGLTGSLMLLISDISIKFGHFSSGLGMFISFTRPDPIYQLQGTIILRSNNSEMTAFSEQIR